MVLICYFLICFTFPIKNLHPFPDPLRTINEILLTNADTVFYFQASLSNIQPSHVRRMRRKEIYFVTIFRIPLKQTINRHDLTFYRHLLVFFP